MNDSEFWELIKSLDSNAPVKLLFICSGNICRSPYMELRFRDLIQKSKKIKNKARFIISSGGFITQKELIDGHPNTRQALAEIDVPKEMIEAFKSRNLRKHKDEMEAALAIITPSEKTNPLVPKKFSDKIVFLSDIAYGRRIETEDPVKIMDFKEYKKYTDELDEMLVALVHKFEELNI